ncbi:hypothetical protein B0J11DRAFT_46897 [Dendryphion nanum]|uniref:Rhodopsin domain-containing protein n=1 Tax=Dendryphion nanum TaxID=256645 RepID=A0A9P9EM67_9PLEO|nr:hypothetical protein B0J11DRAFT_46897 [Dendryphion nanum]
MEYPRGSTNLTSMSDGEFRQRITNAGRINIITLLVTVTSLTSVALCCFIGRIALRLATRRRLFLDDAFLFLAVSCLCGCMSIVHANAFFTFLSNAKVYAPELLKTTAYIHYKSTLGSSVKRRNALAVLSWTTIYSVKFCFYAFFQPLLRHLKKLYRYYWVCVGITFLAWLFSAFKLYMLPNLTGETPDLAFTIAMAVLDCATDAMVVSIPILLLRKSTMKRSTKLSVMAFLSLSSFMAVCSIVRVSGVARDGRHIPDVTWRTMWTQIECCVAVIMGSLMAMRSLFIGSPLQQHQYHRNLRKVPEMPDGSHKRISHPPIPLTNRVSARASNHSLPPTQVSSRKKDMGGEDINGPQVPTMPSPTFFQGRFPPDPPPPPPPPKQILPARVLPRNTPRGTCHKPVLSTTESDFDPSEGDYHAAIRSQGGLQGAWLRSGYSNLA